jgi:hypothetical protein
MHFAIDPAAYQHIYLIRQKALGTLCCVCVCVCARARACVCVHVCAWVGVCVCGRVGGDSCLAVLQVSIGTFTPA